MLTADLVRAYRRGQELRLRPLDTAASERTRALAEQYLAIASACVGRTRGELEEAWAAVPVAARDRKIADGLRKLVGDRCQFEPEAGSDPAGLRREVFTAASAARRALEPGQSLDRDAVLAAIAAQKGMPADEIERLLYVDLRSAHRILAFPSMPAEILVEDYITGQAQAVLLRAVRVRARVHCHTPQTYRELFRKLKFLRLLYRLEAAPDGGYELEIDGPYSMFRSVTKYGLQLALLLPSLRACDRWSVQADVHWGKARMPLSFAIEGSAVVNGAAAEPARLPDEVTALVDRFTALDSPWRPALSAEILALPGVGLCVPDLVFEHARTGTRVYLEVLGFWSREAVWRRVELVEHGLSHRILFAVSSRLRVGEAALDADLPGALYVYKGAMSARAVEERLDRLAS